VISKVHPDVKLFAIALGVAALMMLLDWLDR